MSNHDQNSRSAPAPVRLGISGSLTRAFINSPLTPLLLLASVALGLVALSSLPREEEPQISVPMVDIQVRADGLKAPDAVKLVTEPLERIVKAINGVEHVYSQTADDRVLVTARFFVGTKADDAILRVHDKIRANLDRMPLGIPEPLIVGRGIDDVAIVTLTLSPKPEAADRWTDNNLYHLAEDLTVELAKLDDVGLSYIVGGRPDQIRVEPDPEKLSLYGITLAQLVGKVKEANRSFQAGHIRDQGSRRSGAGRADAAGHSRHRPAAADLARRQAGLCARRGQRGRGRQAAGAVRRPLREGQGGRAEALSGRHHRHRQAGGRQRGDHLGGDHPDGWSSCGRRLIPEDVGGDVTRNYGETANEKANELLFHLGLATVSIVVLIAVAIGWREGVVVLIVIPTTILLTLFASCICWATPSTG